MINGSDFSRINSVINITFSAVNRPLVSIMMLIASKLTRSYISIFKRLLMQDRMQKLLIVVESNTIKGNLLQAVQTNFFSCNSQKVAINHLLPNRQPTKQRITQRPPYKAFSAYSMH